MLSSVRNYCSPLVVLLASIIRNVWNSNGFKNECLNECFTLEAFGVYTVRKESPIHCNKIIAMGFPSRPKLYLLFIVDGKIMVGDLPAVGALPHMSRVTQSVYAALLRAHVEEQGWGEVVSSQVTV